MQKHSSACSWLYFILKKRQIFSKEPPAFIMLWSGCSPAGTRWAVMLRPPICQSPAQVIRCLAPRRCEVRTCKSLFSWLSLFICMCDHLEILNWGNIAVVLMVLSDLVKLLPGSNQLDTTEKQKSHQQILLPAHKRHQEALEGDSGSKRASELQKLWLEIAILNILWAP